MKIRIYPGSGSPTPAHAVATLVLGTRRDRAVRLPAQLQPSARFFLERVEAADVDADLARRLIEVLTRDSVPVLRAVASATPGIRTRGEYRATEPYGTAAYWQAAVGLIPPALGLRFDPDDYNLALKEMEAPQAIAAISPAPEPAPAAPSSTPFTGMLDALLAQLGIGGGLQPAFRGETAPAGEPPIDLEPLIRRMHDDPEFRRAVSQLHLALSHPQFRLLLPAALEAFAGGKVA